MSALDLTQSLVIPPHVIARHMGEEVIILNLNSGTYSGLDAVGARIWELIEQGRRLPEVISTMVTEFDVTEAQLSSDLEVLVDDLVNRGLIELSS